MNIPNKYIIYFHFYNLTFTKYEQLKKQEFLKHFFQNFNYVEFINTWKILLSNIINGNIKLPNFPYKESNMEK